MMCENDFIAISYWFHCNFLSIERSSGAENSPPWVSSEERAQREKEVEGPIDPRSGYEEKTEGDYERTQGKVGLKSETGWKLTLWITSQIDWEMANLPNIKQNWIGQETSQKPRNHSNMLTLFLAGGWCFIPALLRKKPLKCRVVIGVVFPCNLCSQGLKLKGPRRNWQMPLKSSLQDWPTSFSTRWELLLRGREGGDFLWPWSALVSRSSTIAQTRTRHSRAISFSHQNPPCSVSWPEVFDIFKQE